MEILLRRAYINVADGSRPPPRGENTRIMDEEEKRRAMLLGLGFDNSDGKKRITNGDNFCLVGGSEETHERMTETVIKFNEKLSRRGKDLNEISPEEFHDLMREASEH